MHPGRNNERATQRYGGSGLVLHRVLCPGYRQYGCWQRVGQVRTQSSQSGVLEDMFICISGFELLRRYDM
jgi:hypothetical protein